MFGIKTFIRNTAKTQFGWFDYPVNIRINPVGYYCNHACPMCWRMNLAQKDIVKVVELDKNRLTLEEYTNFFTTLPRSIRHVDIVGGGEPLLYPNVQALFSLAKKRNVETRLITNGSLISETIADRLIDVQWNMVRISFHAGSETSYKIVNVSPNYKKVLENIRMLIRKRGKNEFPKVALLFVIQKGNFKDIKKFMNLAAMLGVDEVQFDSLIPYNPAVLLTREDRQKVIQTLRSLRSDTRVMHNIPQVLRLFSTHPKWGKNITTKEYFRGRSCELVQENVDISCDGTVVPCSFAHGSMPGYNIRKQSLLTIWKSTHSFRKDLAQGKFYNFCHNDCNYDIPKKQFSL